MILGMWSGNSSTHSTHQNLEERNRVSLFFLSCKWFSFSGFQTMMPSENQIYKKTGQSVREVLELWAKEEEPMFSSLTIRLGKWSSTCKWSWLILFFLYMYKQEIHIITRIHMPWSPCQNKPGDLLHTWAYCQCCSPCAYFELCAWTRVILKWNILHFFNLGWS